METIAARLTLPIIVTGRRMLCQINAVINTRHEYSPWVDKGSKLYLWNERSLEQAIDYVINGRGDRLPDFD